MGHARNLDISFLVNELDLIVGVEFEIGRVEAKTPAPERLFDAGIELSLVSGWGSDCPPAFRSYRERRVRKGSGPKAGPVAAPKDRSGVGDLIGAREPVGREVSERAVCHRSAARRQREPL